MKEVLSILAGIISFASVLPYIRDMLRGKTHPNIVTWFTLSVLNGVGTVAAWCNGATSSAILTGASLLATSSIFVLGLKSGLRKYTKFDVICQAAALTAIILWKMSHRPGVAIGMVIVAELLAMLPTLRHAWRSPYAETWQTFALATLAAAISLLSLNSYHFSAVAFPIYLLIIDAVAVYIILIRRRPQIKASVASSSKTAPK